jgi:hypothetical protein
MWKSILIAVMLYLTLSKHLNTAESEDNHQGTAAHLWTVQANEESNHEFTKKNEKKVDDKKHLNG